MHQGTIQLIQILEKTVSPGKLIKNDIRYKTCHCAFDYSDETFISTFFKKSTSF